MVRISHPTAAGDDPGVGGDASLALCLHVEGVVQGVGFRPFVHRIAMAHHLGGWVRNASGDVVIEVEGARVEIEAFVQDLRGLAPPLARIERVWSEPARRHGRVHFEILDSLHQPGRRQPVSPDVALCATCEAELFDTANRRFRYPFITCTDCGPRFTVIDAMPYDRERTSMRAFRMCPACAGEYGSPGDRRHHSETNSCPDCGPTVRLWSRTGKGPAGEDAIVDAAAMLVTGGIVAVRGLGGFHLAVDATSEPAVTRLRQRKRRPAKPLAIMVRSLADAAALAAIGPEEERLLTSPARPIVLVPVHADAPLASSVAPGMAQVGIMLAYTPLHHLLLDLAGVPLVMTSGNASEEPIATANEEALRRLAGIADAFLLHDREIVARYDDSVVRVTDSRPVMLRRARGFAPLPLRLPVPTPVPLVAVGPQLKNTFCLADGSGAWVSQHIGDLENYETLQSFQQCLSRMSDLFQVTPGAVVHDQHPGYLSTRIAGELGIEPILAVQHHHAHIAAVMAEHGVTGPVLGVAYDGTGYGIDGTTWGAEFLVADLEGFERVGHLRPAPLPGGDLAARQPWRAALGYLSLVPERQAEFGLAFRGVISQERAMAERQVTQGINAPLASSMGRLFDAAAAVIGLCRENTYEGQAAMELEAAAGRRIATELPFPIVEQPDGRLVLDPLPLLIRLGVRAQRGADLRDLAADFHATVAWGTERMIARLAERSGLRTIALGGGVFQNARLAASMAARLRSLGFTVLLPVELPPGDGAISYGQAAVAAAILARASGTTAGGH